PVPQVRRSGRRAAQRLRHAALAHPQPLRRADRGAHAGGFFKCGDPWHSQTNEVAWVHGIGWQVAVPSNAEDAVGLVRAVLRGNDPVIFFEHRAMLDGAWARRPYPGNEFVVPFGQARLLRAGSELTVVTWGAMVERCEQAAARSHVEVELLDLRTLS